LRSTVPGDPSKYLLWRRDPRRAELLVLALGRERDDHAAEFGSAVAAAE
jgi:hypothetical protein